LAEIAVDLAEVYEVDAKQILADVLATARQFGSAGLLVGVAGPPDNDDAPDPPDAVALEETESPFVPDPAASCMDASFPLGDACSLTVKVGSYLLGVRFSTPELVDMARDVFAPSLVHGVVAPPNVAVKVTEARAGRPLLYCYRSNMLVTRARSPRRAVEAVARLLSSYIRPADGGVKLFALAAVRSGVMTLFTPETWVMAARLVPRLRSAGWEVLDSPEVELDRDGHVVVESLAVALDASALASLPAHRADGIRPAPGRYPVRAWIALAGTADPMPESLAGRVALVTSAIPSLDAESASSVVESTAVMLEGAAWAVSPSLDPNDLASTLAGAVK
jgi:hypothetical protein